MWLCVLGGCIGSVVGVGGYNIGPTKHCLSGTLKPFVSVAGLIPFVNDSLILIAISFRLMQITMPEMEIKDFIEGIIFGRNLPAFTRALLRDGQAYYLYVVFCLPIPL